jgi:hypothetical protein
VTGSSGSPSLNHRSHDRRSLRNYHHHSLSRRYIRFYSHSVLFAVPTVLSVVSILDMVAIAFLSFPRTSLQVVGDLR